GSYRMTIQITLVDVKWRGGRHLVLGQDGLVHARHERRIAAPRILDRLAKTQNIWVKMRLGHSGNAILLPRVGNTRLMPPLPPGCGATKLGKPPGDCSIIAAYRQVPNQRNSRRRCLRLDGAGQRLFHRHRGMTTTLPMQYAG